MKTTGQSSSGWHRVASFMRCPQEYVFSYLYGLRTKEQRPAPTLGTAMHALLAVYYSGDDRYGDALAQIDPGVIVKAKKLFNSWWAYCEGSRLDKMHNVSVEQELEISVGGHRFTRRVDLIYEDRDGQVHIMDHKTCSDIPMRIKQARHDLSLATQVICARRIYGERFNQLWLNLICTSTPELHPFERKEASFMCIPVQFSDGFLENVCTTLAYYLGQVDSFQAEMFGAPRTWHCKVGPHTCDYWKLCAYGPSALCEFDVDSSFDPITEISG